MAIKTTTLTEYVDMNREQLLTKAALSATTLEHVEIMPNVKYKEALNYLDSTIVLADGSTCGWTAQGDDTFTQRTIEVKPLKVNKEFCWKDLRKYWANYQMLFEAGREVLPFEEVFIDANIKAIKNELEKEIWQNGADALFPGFIEVLDKATGVIKGTYTKGTDANPIDVAYGKLTPLMLQQGVTMFVSHTTFRDYVTGLNATCCANRPMIDANADSILYPGDSRVKIVPVSGLEGAETKALVVASAESNLVYGTDVEGSENAFKFWYDDKEDKFMLKVLFNAGVQVKFPDQVVLVTPA